jgi:hypothetical protein
MTLTQALQLLAEKKHDEFMREVSRMISPKPWPHSLIDPLYEEQPDGSIVALAVCKHCGEFGPDEPCSVPPTLIDPPEVVAFRLRDKCKEEGKQAKFLHVVRRFLFDSASPAMARCERPAESILIWLVEKASAEEEIALRLVALGLWEP